VDVLAAPDLNSFYGQSGLACSSSPPIAGKALARGNTGSSRNIPNSPNEYPCRFEAGTLNLPGIADLAAGVRFIKSGGVNAIAEHEANLARLLANGLRQLDGVAVHCEPIPRTSVVAFRFCGRDVAGAGAMLDEEFGIAVRTGLLSAPATHEAIGAFPDGTVRSVSVNSISNDVASLLAAVRKLKYTSPC
jgi:cysteine desulfurase/selenocysteine lyase